MRSRSDKHFMLTSPFDQKTLHCSIVHDKILKAMEDSFSADSLTSISCQAENIKDESISGAVELDMATLQGFEARDIGMRDVTDMWTAPDGSFSKCIVKKGSGFATPNDGASCQVTICVADPNELVGQEAVGYPTGEEVEIMLGDGCGRFSEAIDACLETMHRGEECELQVFDRNHVETVGRTHCKDTEEMKSEEQVGQESNMVASFHVILHSFTRNKDVFEMSVADILARVSQLKDYGTKCFKEGRLQLAERFYIRAGRYLIMVCHPTDVKDLDETERQQYQLLKKGCSLNLAACQLKHKRYHDVITHCMGALDVDPLNLKALYRRCQAYIMLDEFEKARTDIQTALKEEPKSKAFLEQNRLLVKREKQVYNKLSRGMNKMFGGS